jgi:hypothetical protein
VLHPSLLQFLSGFSVRLSLVVCSTFEILQYTHYLDPLLHSAECLFFFVLLVGLAQAVSLLMTEPSQAAAPVVLTPSPDSTALSPSPSASVEVVLKTQPTPLQEMVQSSSSRSLYAAAPYLIVISCQLIWCINTIFG